MISILYFANPNSPAARKAMEDGHLGWIDTPAQGNVRPLGVAWCADNGAFSDKWDADVWWRWLVKNQPFADTCVFAVAPDVVGNHGATLERSREWLLRIRNLGYPVAFVAQDGATIDTVPWDDFEVLFIGGAKTENPRDEWKLGPHARTLIAHAKHRGMWVHVGRVNGGNRFAAMAALGCDSCDGTKLVYGPDVNLPLVMGWRQRFLDQPAMFTIGETA